MRSKHAFSEWFGILVLTLFIILGFPQKLRAETVTHTYDNLYRLIQTAYPDGTTTTYPGVAGTKKV